MEDCIKREWQTTKKIHTYECCWMHAWKLQKKLVTSQTISISLRFERKKYEIVVFNLIIWLELRAHAFKENASLRQQWRRKTEMNIPFTVAKMITTHANMHKHDAWACVQLCSSCDTFYRLCVQRGKLHRLKNGNDLNTLMLWLFFHALEPKL